MNNLDDFLILQNNRRAHEWSRFNKWMQGQSAIEADDKPNNDVLIIAEIGLSHGGNYDSARQQIHLAKQAGADMVKFQLLMAEDLIHPEIDFMGEAFRIFESCQLNYKDFRNLAEYAKQLEIDFIATPFAKKSLLFLDSLNVVAIKIASGDINNFLLLKEAALLQRPLILSTGASTWEEVEHAVSYIQSKGCHQIAILHCLSEYPAEIDRVNWNSIPFLKEHLPYPVGFSDHTQGIHGSLIAVSMGARAIEKHFTLEKKSGGIDNEISLNPEQFALMVQEIRKLQKGFGTYQKKPSHQERQGNSFGRRGLYYSRSKKSGQRLYEEDIIALRPQNGISPAHIDSIVGQRLVVDVERLEPLAWEDMTTAK